MQVLLKLLSADITLSHRPKDTELVEKSAQEAQKRYKDIAGRESNIFFDPSLSDDSPGGVIGTSMGGRIKVDNTLEERLRILEEKVRIGYRYLTEFTNGRVDAPRVET